MFALSLVPMVVKRVQVPLVTALPTAVVLVVWAINYSTIHFWYAATVETFCATCWWLLVFRRDHA